MGYTYDLKFNVEYKEVLTSFVKLESNGPFDFDAPIMSDKKIDTFYGEVDNYSMPEVIPRVEEYWVDSLVFDFPVKFKLGQYSYQAGNGYALGGYYENYGISVYSTNEDFKWTVYYAKPDLVNKIGSSGKRVGNFEQFYISFSIQVRIFSRRYSSSLNPYALLCITRILLLRPSTKPNETLFLGLL